MPRLTRAQIAQVAVALADSEGFEAVTMRRVAAELNAGTMSLYHYVRTKADLVALMDEAIMAEVVIPAGEMPEGWREAMSAMARRSRAVLMRHAWILSSRQDPPFGPNAMRHVEQFLAALASTHLDGPTRLELLALMNAYVFGTVLESTESLRRAAMARDNSDAVAALIAFGMRQLASGEYPHLASLFAPNGGGKGPSVPPMDEAGLDKQFERGLQTVLDGVSLRYGLDPERIRVDADVSPAQSAS